MSKETIEMGDLEKPAESATKHVEGVGAPFGVRHIQVLLNFFLTFIAYGIRVNLSVGIVAMTTRATDNPDIPIYDWHDKSIILSSFFWGYIIPQVGAGQLAKRFGPKWFLVGTMTICSLFSLLLPVMAQTLGSEGVMICRALQGFCQGFFFPSIHNLLSHWVPISERSRLGTFVYAGNTTRIGRGMSSKQNSRWSSWYCCFDDSLRDNFSQLARLAFDLLHLWRSGSTVGDCYGASRV
jgi:sugar phosphate permease